MDKPPLSFPWMASFSQSTVANLTRTAETCQKACLAWQEEVARFAAARLQRDSDVAQKVLSLLTSRNWSEALKVQRDWLTSTGQDYFEEATRLAQLAQKVGADVTHGVPMRGAAE